MAGRMHDNHKDFLNDIIAAGPSPATAR